MQEPLSPHDAKRFLRDIIENGNTSFSPHSREEMEKDNMTDQDVVNVLRGGAVQPGEYENGSWRYQVQTQRMCVVVAFRHESEVCIVSAWRFKP